MAKSMSLRSLRTTSRVSKEMTEIMSISDSAEESHKKLQSSTASKTTIACPMLN
jgi:hypothetical protein